MKAHFTSIAELELKEAMEFYETQRAGLGFEFLTEVEATIRLIEAYPEAFGWHFHQERGVAASIASLTACSIKSGKQKSWSCR